jgi:hypothetical protein
VAVDQDGQEDLLWGSNGVRKVNGMKTQEACIIVEQAFPHAPTKVWRAVVDVEQMGRWFFDDIHT